MFVLGDLQARVERLVREPSVPAVGVRVGAVRVGEESQGVVEERPRPGVVLVVFAEALLDVGEPGSDAGMWPLLVSKLRGLGVSLGLPLACPSFSGPESFFGGWGSAPFLGSLWCWLFLVFGYESPGGFPVVAPVL